MEVGDKVKIKNSPAGLEDIGIEVVLLEKVLGKEVYEKEFTIYYVYPDGYVKLEGDDELFGFDYSFAPYLLIKQS
jgi:hypothetical protein